MVYVKIEKGKYLNKGKYYQCINIDFFFAIRKDRNVL